MDGSAGAWTTGESAAPNCTSLGLPGVLPDPKIRKGRLGTRPRGRSDALQTNLGPAGLWYTWAMASHVKVKSCIWDGPCPARRQAWRRHIEMVVAC